MTTLKASHDTADSRSGASQLPRLLIIDDDPSVRKLLRFRLKDSYEIVDTGSPEDALALALEDRPDAILLDLGMPGYSGFEVCRNLATLSLTKGIPIIIVSGQSSAEYREYCERLGAKAFFQKPVDIDGLRKALARFIEGRVHERHGDPRVHLRVPLTLRGTDSTGKAFEIPVTTENVSAQDFLVACHLALKEGATVDVHLTKSAGKLIGKARVAHLESPGTAGQRCDFHFIEKPVEWVLR